MFAVACLTADGAAASLDDALALCRRTYEYVSQSIPAHEAKRFAQEMAVDAKWAATAKTPAERAIVEKVVRRLRRRILFAHPDLQFDRLLCVQRDVPYSRFNHMIDQYLGRFSHAGPGLVVIENWRTFPEKKLLLAGKLPTGCVLNPDLHWDADRVIFAFCDHTAKPPEGFDPAKYGFHSDVTPNSWNLYTWKLNSTLGGILTEKGEIKTSFDAMYDALKAE